LIASITCSKRTGRPTSILRKRRLLVSVTLTLWRLVQGDWSCLPKISQLS